eukprot:7458065-Ditylum_brightwellii.AAC.1
MKGGWWRSCNHHHTHDVFEGSWYGSMELHYGCYEPMVLYDFEREVYCCCCCCWYTLEKRKMSKVTIVSMIGLLKIRKRV